MDRTLHNGREDGLEPLQSLDIKKPGGLPGLLRGMGRTAFGGRQLGQAFEVLCTMARDEGCKIVLTVSGAMTIAKMGLVICDMIESGLADIVVSTGAIMAHGLSEAIGGVHYKYDPGIADEKLYSMGYNRVYDTLEMEANLCDTERIVSQALSSLDWSKPTCSMQINRTIGSQLIELGMMPSVLGCAAERNVPVYVPAFTDSEIGLDTATHVFKGALGGSIPKNPASLFNTLPNFNPFGDLCDYTERIMSAERIGIVTIGGGVPRNWAQQVGPFVDIVNMRLGTEFETPRFRYGVRICPEPVHWGGLSGCTYSEGVSWGKFVSPAEGGMFAEVYCDATIAWPLLVRAVLEEIGSIGEDDRNE